MRNPFRNHLPRGLVSIDLGTTNTLVYAKGKGVLLDEPSVAIIDGNTREVLAVGEEAKKLSHRHGPELESFRPLRDGVITDFEILSSMIRLFLAKVFTRFSLLRRDFALTVPAGITPVEKRALNEAAKKAGAGKVYFVQEPIAAAIGAGLRIDQPRGHLVVDIGGGTTEIAVITKFAIACCDSLRVAGDELDEAIRQHLHRMHNVDISPTMAESIKIKMGSVSSFDGKLNMTFRAKDVTTGSLKEVTVSEDEVREAIRKPVLRIISAVQGVLEEAPPDATTDFVEEGIWLTGGGALLRGWQQLFLKESGLDVSISHDPLRSTIRGIGEATERIALYQNIFYNGDLPRYPYS